MSSASAAAREGHRAGLLGALGGQMVLAGASLLLQLLAARTLGAAGLGSYALIFGGIVMATALSSGLVGDSLTALDRHRPDLRAALVRLGVLAVLIGAVLVGLLSLLSSAISWQQGLVVAVAAATFMSADLVRRLLMASGQFWHLPVIDLLGLGAALLLLAILGGHGELVHGELGLVDFLGALALAQAVAAVAGWLLLPAVERTRLGIRGGDVRSVLSFGTWRAAQQFLRPTALHVTRTVVLVSAGVVAVGQLEAARLLVAPALLFIQGLGSYLFASYAKSRDEPVAVVLGRADRGTRWMLLAGLACGAVAVLALPLLEKVISRGEFSVPAAAVLGWCAYALSCAVVLPYGTVAAVRGRPALAFVVRLLDATAGCVAVAVALLIADAPPSAAPWLLSMSAVLAAGYLRRSVADAGVDPVADSPSVVVGGVVR